MTFPQKAVDDLLVRCQKRCCICHRHCGIKIEIDHIVPKAKGGEDIIDNAIALCFECHAEVHLYNDKHPKGRKYHPNELRGHKEQWLRICEKFPNKLSKPSAQTDGGPLSGLFTELEFNWLLMRMSTFRCPLETYQFQRAVSDGILSLVDDSLRNTIMSTYGLIKTVNHELESQSRLNPSATEAIWTNISRTELMKLLIKSIQETMRTIDSFLAQK